MRCLTVLIMVLLWLYPTHSIAQVPVSPDAEKLYTLLGERAEIIWYQVMEPKIRQMNIPASGGIVTLCPMNNSAQFPRVFTVHREEIMTKIGPGTVYFVREADNLAWALGKIRGHWRICKVRMPDPTHPKSESNFQKPARIEELQNMKRYFWPVKNLKKLNKTDPGCFPIVGLLSR